MARIDAGENVKGKVWAAVEENIRGILKGNTVFFDVRSNLWDHVWTNAILSVERGVVTAVEDVEDAV